MGLFKKIKKQKQKLTPEYNEIDSDELKNPGISQKNEEDPKQLFAQFLRQLKKLIEYYEGRLS